jgi:shikimate dehydrogenase
MDRYAVFGNPIAHSISPSIHASFAKQCGQSVSYEKILVPLDGFAAAIDVFIAAGGRGANVTVPFKLDAFKVATQLTDRARAAAAVNTLSFENGHIIGDNTDGIGLVNDLTRNAHIGLKDKRILLLGAGGAAQGVILPLLQAQPAALVIANRTVSKALAIADRMNQFGSEHGLLAISACSLAALATATPFDIVINATAASLSDAAPDVSPTIFGPQAIAFDMMYAATPTAFLRFAAAHGAATRDGLGMLVEQAGEAFYVWRGIRVDTVAVLAALREMLQ